MENTCTYLNLYLYLYRRDIEYGVPIVGDK